jgi:hypothetical protein
MNSLGATDSATRDTGQVVDAMEAIALAMQDGAASTGPDAPPAPLPRDAPPSRAEERARIERTLERGISALEADSTARVLALRETVAALVTQIYGARTDPPAPSPAPSVALPAAPPPAPDQPVRDESAAHDRAHLVLADRFLHGPTATTAAADPRLVRAWQAQQVMEQHIAAVFAGDADAILAATAESRRRIWDGLRQGLAVRPATTRRAAAPI